MEFTVTSRRQITFFGVRQAEPTWRFSGKAHVTTIEKGGSFLIRNPPWGGSNRLAGRC